jgi:hypothetical protein
MAYLEGYDRALTVLENQSAEGEAEQEEEEEEEEEKESESESSDDTSAEETPKRRK